MKFKLVLSDKERRELVGEHSGAKVWINDGWMLYCGPQLSSEFKDSLVISIVNRTDSDRTLYPYVVIHHETSKARENLAHGVACVFIQALMIS